MSLLDSDKTSGDRTNPVPNSDDSIADGQRMAHQTASSHYKPTSSTSTARLQQVGKSFIANDGTTNRAIFGYSAALNDWGEFVTKPGFDALTDNNPAHYIFNSSQNVFKVVLTGSVTFAPTAQNSTQTVTVTHGLGIVPTVVASLNDGTKYYSLPWYSINLVGGTINVQVAVENITTTTLDIIIRNTTLGPIPFPLSGTPSVRYYLLQETAN